MNSPTGNLTLQSPVVPVAIWLGAQLLALGISAARIPFFATKSFPQPAELLALSLMVTVQIVLSALLFPFLMRDARTAGLIIVSSWPMTVLAGVLTGLPTLRGSAVSTLLITVWLVGLALWRVVLRSPRLMAVGVTLATMIALAGPFAQYLSLEYSTSQAATSVERANLIFNIIAASGTGPIARPMLLITVVYLTLALAAWSLTRLALRNAKKPDSSNPAAR